MKTYIHKPTKVQAIQVLHDDKKTCELCINDHRIAGAPMARTKDGLKHVHNGYWTVDDGGSVTVESPEDFERKYRQQGD